MKIDVQQIIKNLENKTDEIYRDNEMLRELIEAAKVKTKGNKQLMEIWDDLKILIELVKDWLKGDYVDLSKNTIIMVIIALIYLVSPIDLIPDFLPGGYLDDILVIAYVVKKISGELEIYKEWKYKNNNNNYGEVVNEEDIFEEDIFED